MTPDLLLHLAIRPALALLPLAMTSREAEAFLVAIAWQESDGLQARRQYLDGPARGWWQFEPGGGTAGVLAHVATRAIARDVCEALTVPATTTAVQIALEWQDVLAAAFARLLLWTLPGALPRRDERDRAWHQYAVQGWRPGKPHPAKWPTSWAVGWAAVETNPRRTD